jgi:hypothetical protein
MRLDASYLYKGLSGKVKLIQLDATQEFQLKITRN